MSQPDLYRQPTLLDNVEHRHLKLARLNDHSMAAGMHASFVAATEFALAAREFAILFVRSGGENQNGKQPPEAWDHGAGMIPDTIYLWPSLARHSTTASGEG